MAIVINLVSDWEEIQLEEFKKFIDSWGFESHVFSRFSVTLRGTKEWNGLREDALMTWFNFQRRRMPACPRRIVHNPSLICPPEVLQGWTMLQQEIKRGDDLTPRLSRKILDVDYNDGMLNDWGFHHFHLGTSFDPKHPRLVQGTRIVLVAIVDPSEIYPIDFVAHGNWGDRALLKKAISTYPERCERFRIKGLRDDVATPSIDEDVVKMRRCGVNSLSRFDDKLYSPLGIGVSTAGTSIAAMMALDLERKRLQEVESQLLAHLVVQHYSGEVRLIRAQQTENSLCLEVRCSGGKDEDIFEQDLSPVSLHLNVVGGKIRYD